MLKPINYWKECKEAQGEYLDFYRGDFVCPANFKTKNAYQGMNSMILEAGNYLTFKQAKDMGLKMVKGAVGREIFKYLSFEKKVGVIKHDDGTQEDITEEKGGFKRYHVFAREWFDGDINTYKEMNISNFPAELAFLTNVDCVKELTLYVGGYSAYHAGGNRKVICMPREALFLKREFWLKTWVHEVGHCLSTKAGNKDYKGKNGKPRKGNKVDYAVEEVRAESFAVMLCKLLGINTSELNHKLYLKGWGGLKGVKEEDVLDAINWGFNSAKAVFDKYAAKDDKPADLLSWVA